jgi:hypothetical protein
LSIVVVDGTLEVRVSIIVSCDAEVQDFADDPIRALDRHSLDLKRGDLAHDARVAVVAEGV